MCMCVCVFYGFVLACRFWVIVFFLFRQFSLNDKRDTITKVLPSKIYALEQIFSVALVRLAMNDAWVVVPCICRFWQVLLLAVLL